MSTTQPVRNRNDLRKLRNFYKDTEPNYRNYTLICMGFNTALRINDLLALKWEDVYDFDKKLFRGHIYVTEEKTQKQNCICLNKNVREALLLFCQSEKNLTPDLYLFRSSRCTDNKPLNRTTAYRIIRHASEALHLGNNISCHSMRKTFGYQAWKAGIQPALLMNIYNHSSYEITKIYLGIDQDDKDKVFNRINL